ncbi:MAG: thiopeptide-type bacteriocin biosynthesis protein [Flavobacterium sp.]|uniref:thiopeptide-type bacteriocin biosynthesis protein n=1 Tax=Flavobacterium sp. TaxID=239 RepID=UPI0032643E3F
MREILLKKQKTKKGYNHSFFPGNSWCYFKIYCSHLVGERVICEVIKPLITKLQSKEENLCWFFIRYEDTDHHIRLRIASSKIAKITYKLNKLLTPLIQEGYIFSMQIDTYKREIERYQENNIELSETLFCYDSQAVIDVVEIINHIGDEDIRWRTAILSVDYLLNDFEVSLEEKMQLMEDLYKGFMPEFVDMSDHEALKRFKSSIDTKLRQYNSLLDEIIRLKNYDSLQNFVPIFNKRSYKNQTIVPQIKENIVTTQKLITLVKDYIHMNLNRIFPTNARMHELVIYFLMFKAYYSNYNRNKALLNKGFTSLE